MDEVATGIFVGTEADASDKALLQKHGIDAVVSLTLDILLHVYAEESRAVGVSVL